jgi:hypothetical protein
MLEESEENAIATGEPLARIGTLVILIWVSVAIFSFPLAQDIGII